MLTYPPGAGSGYGGSSGELPVSPKALYEQYEYALLLSQQQAPLPSALVRSASNDGDEDFSWVQEDISLGGEGDDANNSMDMTG